MKQPAIALTAKDFRHAVMLAGKALERRGSTIPILDQIHCKANGSFEATGTDLDMSILARVERMGKAEATFMLPDFRTVLGATAAAGADDVALAKGDNMLSIVSGALRVDFKGTLPADDFPTLAPIAEERFTGSLSLEQLRSMARIAASISTEETRYYLNGIYLHQVSGRHFHAVATDGHRMSIIDFVIPDASGDLPGIIIPRKAVRRLLEIAGKRASSQDAGVKIRVGSPQIRNSVESTAPRPVSSSTIECTLAAGPATVVMTSKTIDGTYPDYKRVIPTETCRSMAFDRAELRRAVVALSYGPKHVRAIKIEPNPGGATLSCADPTFGSSIDIACKHMGWPKGEFVGFNGNYVLSMIDAAGGEEIVIASNDSSGPSLIRNTADTAWTGLLMPMRV